MQARHCGWEPSCSGRGLADAAGSGQPLLQPRPACQQSFRNTRPCVVTAAAPGMRPWNPLHGILQGSGQPVLGCMLNQRPLPVGLTRLRDRKSVNGTVLVEQPDATLQYQGREALEFAVTSFHAETNIPTTFGKMRVRAYRHSTDGGNTFTEPMAIMTGRPEGQREVPVRVHDACFTSEVLGSLKCDCAEQLKLAMDFIQQNQPGIVIYLQQEGRGIGLANKIAAYALQEEGYDTVDANRALGYPDDCREYTSVHNILRDLGVKSIRLMTNNPRKMALMRALDIEVVDRIPCIVQAQEFSEGYLAAKAARMSHELDGSYCFWEHGGEPLPPQRTVNGSMDGGDGSDTPPFSSSAASSSEDEVR